MKGMSSREYRAIYKKTTRVSSRNYIKLRNQISRGYAKAAAEVADLITKFPAGTAENILLQSIQSQLDAATTSVGQMLLKDIPGFISKSHESFARLEVDYLSSHFAAANAPFKKEIMEKSYFAINERLLLAQANRAVNGLYFSDRIWDTVGKDFQGAIKDTIQAGFSQGRDLIDIAKDIEVYTGTTGSKQKLIKRYGKLQDGTADFIKRIPKSVDYRALRIARSEMYASLQQANAIDAEANPGCSGQVNWILTEGAQHSCECPDLAAGSPYPADSVPAYPHPNCLCTLQPVMKSRDEFRKEIDAFMRGQESPDMERWYNNFYLPSEQR